MTEAARGTSTDSIAPPFLVCRIFFFLYKGTVFKGERRLDFHIESREMKFTVDVCTIKRYYYMKFHINWTFIFFFMNKNLDFWQIFGNFQINKDPLQIGLESWFFVWLLYIWISKNERYRILLSFKIFEIWFFLFMEKKKHFPKGK